MKRLKYRLVLGLVFCMTMLEGYGQLEKVENHYGQLEKLAKHQSVTLRFMQPDTKLVEDYTRLSQIILIRHGEPAMEHEGRKKRSEAIQYIKDYDSVGVYPPSFIPLSLMPGELNVIYTSSINRAVSTAQQVVNQNELLQTDPLFREFERKIFAFPNVRLPIRTWLSVSRVLWFLGLNDKGIENRADARKRAQKAAVTLEQDAMKYGKTLLVAHGLLNRSLEKHLNKRGWITVYDGGNGYLSQKLLVKYQQ